MRGNMDNCFIDIIGLGDTDIRVKRVKRAKNIQVLATI